MYIRLQWYVMLLFKACFTVFSFTFVITCCNGNLKVHRCTYSEIFSFGGKTKAIDSPFKPPICDCKQCLMLFIGGSFVWNDLIVKGVFC